MENTLEYHKNENEWTTRRWKYSEPLKHNVEQMKFNTKGMHTVRFDWYQVQKLAELPKLIEVCIEVSFGRIRSLGGGLCFWDAVNILFLDLGPGYMGLVTLLKFVVLYTLFV